MLGLHELTFPLTEELIAWLSLPPAQRKALDWGELQKKWKARQQEIEADVARRIQEDPELWV